MMRVIGISTMMIGIMGIFIEVTNGKVFISSILICIGLIILGSYTYVRNMRVKFPKFDNNNNRRRRVIEDITLEITDDLDHLNNIQNVLSKMKRNDEIFFELTNLQGKENQVKVTNSKRETLGIIPYTYPHRKFLAYQISNGTTVLGKVFKMTKSLTGKYSISISIAPY